MKIRKILLVVLVFFFFGASVRAQNEEPKIMPTVNLNGPRLGLTYIGEGPALQKMEDAWGRNVNPLVSQFGWQFEAKFFSLPSGTAGLVEAVVLVGGLEQNLFLPSTSFLIGLRSANGLEFGFGPNISLSGAAFVFAVGVTVSSHDINFPINLALVPASDGVRASLLIGFNARKH